VWQRVSGVSVPPFPTFHLLPSIPFPGASSHHHGHKPPYKQELIGVGVAAVPLGIVVWCWCWAAVSSLFHLPSTPQAIAQWGWGQVVHYSVRGLYVLLVAQK
jgi:hypothetical protein